jgi:hypothetical protein
MGGKAMQSGKHHFFGSLKFCAVVAQAAIDPIVDHPADGGAPWSPNQLIHGH